MIFGADTSAPDFGEPLSQTIEIPSFQIEQTEVTYQLYSLCVQAEACDKPVNDDRYGARRYADYPIRLSAVLAWKYCHWLDRRLPDEYEWEFAARGAQGRLWPWGDWQPVTGTANILVEGEMPGEVQPRRSFPDDRSPEGVYDLAGNVQEWTGTVLRQIDGGPKFDRVGRWNGVDQVTLAVRGSAYDLSPARITQTSIVSSVVSDQPPGFRCAQDAAQ
jgi:formylglycine-generating enzyme required for sulfatase activity